MSFSLVEIVDYMRGKMIYVDDESNCISAYYFENNEELDNDVIEENIEDIFHRYNSLKKYKSNDNELIKIGGIEIEENYLSHIEVDSKHHRRGIGSKLIELAINHFELMYVACVLEHKAYKYCLTLHGEKLIAGCIRKKIVTEEMCIFAGMDNSILEEGESDPLCYDSIIIKNELDQLYVPIEEKTQTKTDNTLLNYFKKSGARTVSERFSLNNNKSNSSDNFHEEFETEMPPTKKQKHF